MSSHELEPDDEDTGPLHVERLQRSAPDPREQRFDAPMSVNPRPVHRDRRPVVLLTVGTVAVVGLGVIAWLFWPSSDGPEAAGDANAATTTESDDATEAGLLAMLPKGYDVDACEVVVPPEGALAQVSCSENNDPGGPLTATYALVKDDESLRVLFDGVVSTSSVVDCPGNTQSPGPWRRNATPQQTAGTLVCGFQQGKPMVVWTTEADLLVSEVESGPLGPNMVQLYTWWASHS